jgi:hypothetical protein
MLKLGYVSRARSCHVILPWARQINLSSTLVRALPNLSSKLGRTHSNILGNLGAPTPNYQAIWRECT